MLVCMLQLVSEFAFGAEKSHTTRPAQVNAKAATGHGWRQQFAQQAASQKWRISIGAGLVVSPRYQGRDQMRVLPIPTLSILYRNRWLLSSYQGAGLYWLHGRHFKWSSTLNYNFRGSSAIKNMNTGFNEIENFLTFNNYVSWRWRMFDVASSYMQAISHNYGGLWQTRLGLGVPLTQNLLASVGPSVSWATQRYMRTFFGVNAQEAKATGLRQNIAHAGVMQLGVATNVMWFYKRVFAQVLYAGNWYQGDAYDSPLLQNRFQSLVLFTFSYRLK